METDLQPRPDGVQHPPYTVLLPITVAVALLCAVGSLVWAFLLQGRLTRAEQQITASQQVIQQRFSASDARARAASEAFAKRLGTTQEQINTLLIDHARRGRPGLNASASPTEPSCRHCIGPCHAALAGRRGSAPERPSPDIECPACSRC